MKIVLKHHICPCKCVQTMLGVLWIDRRRTPYFAVKPQKTPTFAHVSAHMVFYYDTYYVKLILKLKNELILKLSKKTHLPM